MKSATSAPCAASVPLRAKKISAAVKVQRTTPPVANMPPRFAMTYCSQCGSEMGPGDDGFSHCEDHWNRPPWMTS